jgi:hypothetical protein
MSILDLPSASSADEGIAEDPITSRITLIFKADGPIEQSNYSLVEEPQALGGLEITIRWMAFRKVICFTRSNERYLE